MISLDPLFLVTVLVVSLIAGFGWTVGSWLWGKIVSGRQA